MTTESTPIIAKTSLSKNYGLIADTDLIKFEALQYSLFSTSFIEVLGGIFFLITAAFIIKDKKKAYESVRENQLAVPVAPLDINEIS